MKVKEIIEYLNRFDGDREVVLFNRMNNGRRNMFMNIEATQKQTSGTTNMVVFRNLGFVKPKYELKNDSKPKTI